MTTDDLLKMLEAELDQTAGIAFDLRCDLAAAKVREEAQAAEIARLRDRSYRLAAAIMGGEDAPGYADSIPTEQLEELERSNDLLMSEEADRLRAEIERLREALEGAAEELDCAAQALEEFALVLSREPTEATRAWQAANAAGFAATAKARNIPG